MAVNAGSFLQQCCASPKDAALTWRTGRTSTRQVPMFIHIIGNTQGEETVEYLGNMRAMG